MSKKSFYIHNLSEDTIIKIKLIAALRGESIAQVIEGAIETDMDMLKSNPLLSKAPVTDEDINAELSTCHRSVVAKGGQ